MRQKTSRGDPGAHAALTLPISLGSRAVGDPVGTSVTIDTSGARVTHVVGITTSSPGGSYGAGQVIRKLNFGLSGEAYREKSI